MTEADVAYLGVGETLRGAGHRMRELGVAALPVCGQDGKFHGIITRGMMAESIAAGGDPKAVTVGEVASMRSPPPSAVRQAVPASGAPEEHNKRVAPVTGDYRRTREATGIGLLRYGAELRIGELADAVRAAADALSQLSAVHGCA
jgi:CBS domain-containing protein